MKATEFIPGVKFQPKDHDHRGYFYVVRKPLQQTNDLFVDTFHKDDPQHRCESNIIKIFPSGFKFMAFTGSFCNESRLIKFSTLTIIQD